MKTEMKGRRRHRSATAATIAATTLLLAGCGETPLSTFDAQSPIAERLDNFLIALLIVCGVVFVIVQGMVIYMSRRFGVEAPDDESMIYPDEEFPDQVHGNTRLEIGWTILPTVIMAVVAFFTLGILFDLDDVDAVPDRRVQSVDVIGQQWWWEYRYYFDTFDLAPSDLEDPMDLPPADIVTSGQFATSGGRRGGPASSPRRDVIHSHWIPEPQRQARRRAGPVRIPWKIEADELGRSVLRPVHGVLRACPTAYMRMQWVIAIERRRLPSVDRRSRWLDAEATCRWHHWVRVRWPTFNENSAPPLHPPMQRTHDARSRGMEEVRPDSCASSSCSVNGFNGPELDRPPDTRSFPGRLPRI